MCADQSHIIVSTTYCRAWAVNSVLQLPSSMSTIVRVPGCCYGSGIMSLPSQIRKATASTIVIDNGILGLFLIDKDAMLLENLVALQLFRIYGHDLDNERVFFYHDNCEVDFYIPDDELAIQVSYTLRDEEVRKREIEALKKLPKRLPCTKRMILTYDEEESVNDQHGTIEVVPVWKWLMG